MNWALVVGVIVTMATASLGRLGGVRFVVDAGLCEPGDVVSQVSLGTIVRRDDDGTITRAKGLPFPATCHTEVGGLAQGRYVVRVAPPRDVLPPYSVSFEVLARTWTEVRLTLPPVIVRGRITSNGQPVAGVVPNFTPAPETLALPRSREEQPSAYPLTASDADGRYVAVVSGVGAYTQSFNLKGQDLPVAGRDVVFGFGVNLHDVEVGAGAIRIWFTEQGAPLATDLPVSLTMHALPQRPFSRTIQASSAPVDVSSLAPGAYVVRAEAQRRSADGRTVSLVSAGAVDVAVSAHQSTDVTIDLVARDGWLEVVDPHGRPIEGAAVITYVGATSLRTNEDGRAPLHTLPVGARVPIRTRTWGMTCHVVSNDLLQRVVIADASETVTVRIAHTSPSARPTAPEVLQLRDLIAGASVTGLAGATCPLPFEAFSVAEGRVPGAVELTVMLPDGWYTLTLRDGRTFRFQAPGRIEIK